MKGKISSGDQIKILIFSLIMLPSVIFIVGIIPAIFLIFGIYMMKRNQDFSYISTAAAYFKGYVWVALIICSLSAAYWWNEHINAVKSYDYEYYFFIWLMLALVAFFYLVSFQFLFFAPSLRNKEWVEKNGFFSTASKIKEPETSAEVNIIKGEKLKQYSVADELIKWAKLKDDGHISEEEFKEARDKLLRKN